MMQRSSISLLLLLLFLCFSSYLVLSASAVPATRTQNLDEGSEDASALISLAKNVQKLGNNVEEVLIDVEERFINRRMDLETQDYEGTGANRDHDPKAPGTV